MLVSEMSEGMISEYHHQAVKILSVDEPHHQAQVQSVDGSKTMTVDYDELEDQPQCHPDSFSYY